MKKNKTITVRVCDYCKSEGAIHSCLYCGRDWCCKNKCKQSSVVYEGGEYNNGFVDGTYCLQCDNKLRHLGKDGLHAAYLEIHKLMLEQMCWRKKFELKRAAAEKNVIKHLRLRRGKR